MFYNAGEFICYIPELPQLSLQAAAEWLQSEQLLSAMKVARPRLLKRLKATMYQADHCVEA